MSRILALIAISAVVGIALGRGEITRLGSREIKDIQLKKGEPSYFSFWSGNLGSVSLGFSRSNKDYIDIYISRVVDSNTRLPGPDSFDFRDTIYGEGVAEVLSARTTKNFVQNREFIVSLASKVDTSLKLYFFDSKTFLELRASDPLRIFLDRDSSERLFQFEVAKDDEVNLSVVFYNGTNVTVQFIGGPIAGVQDFNSSRAITTTLALKGNYPFTSNADYSSVVINKFLDGKWKGRVFVRISAESFAHFELKATIGKPKSTKGKFLS